MNYAKASPLLCLSLAMCATTHDFAFPEAPDLSPETARPCPALPLVTGELGDLAMKDTGASIEYARCQARAASAVGAYQTLQAQLRAAATAASKVKEPN